MLIYELIDWLVAFNLWNDKFTSCYLYDLNVNRQAPVNYLPRVGQVSNYLHRDEDFFFDIDGADHVVQELPGVRQELTDLQVRLELVELLDLEMERKH